MQPVTGKDAAATVRLVKHAADGIHYWLRKLGLTPEQRRAFWLAQAARER